MICLTAYLQIPHNLQAKATYALRELCHRAGFGLRIRTTGPANLLYTTEIQPQDGHSIILHCNPNLYHPATNCELHSRPDARAWEQSGIDTSQPLDIVGGCYRLLTLLDEYHVPAEARDRLGRFRTDALPSERKKTKGTPLVELHAAVLADKLRKQWPDLFMLASPTWPGGQRYALVLSHDCDHVHIGAPAEVATNVIKSLLRSSSAHAQLAYVGMRSMFRGRENPFFKFGAWNEWESQRGIHSAFYLPVRPHGVPFDRNDCKSTIEASVADWELFKKMAASGWEFGLHATIHTRKHPWAFQAAREWLESRLQQPVCGVRHHYFALDGEHPYKSHRMHAEAGFTYDSSIAFCDVGGFRSGTCLPYSAFDPLESVEIPLNVLPCTLMDGHILSDRPSENGDYTNPIAAAQEVISNVRRYEGVLMLNWHQEAAFNHLTYAGWLNVLDGILTPCLHESVWTTTAQELCSYWRQRDRELDSAGEMPNLMSRVTRLCNVS